MPNRVEEKAKQISDKVAGIIQKTRPEAPINTQQRDYFKRYLVIAATHNILNEHNVCVGLHIIETFFTQLNIMNDYRTDSVFHETDKMYCIIAMMLAHKGPDGEDIHFNNKTFFNIFMSIRDYKYNSDQLKICDKKIQKVFNEYERSMINFFQWTLPHDESAFQQYQNEIFPESSTQAPYLLFQNYFRSDSNDDDPIYIDLKNH